jgi:predicted enzyme related to lactoylglutathione lyase
MAGKQPVGGIFDTTSLPGNIPEHWLPYLAVDDVDARCAKARQAGATIIREPFDIPKVGRIAILKEPGGAMVGWMTPAS